MGNEENTSFIQSLKQTWLTEEEPQEAEEVDEGPPPSRSPFLSDLIKTYRRLREGKATVEEMKAQIKCLFSRLESTMGIYEKLFEPAGGDPQVRMIAEKANAAFLEHKEALLEMEKYFDDRVEDHLINGIRVAEKCTDRLFDIYEEFTAISEEATKKSCLQCGHKSPPDLKYCQKCGTQFPIISPDIHTSGEAPGGEKAGKDMLSGNTSIPSIYMGIYEGIEKIKKGEISGEDFVATVEPVMAMFNEARGQVKNLLTNKVEEIDVEASLKSSVRETGKLLTDGIEDAISGMEQLVMYVSIRNPKTLYDGWTRMMNGGQQMLIAQTRYGELCSATAARIESQARTGEEQIEHMTQEACTFQEEDE